MTTATIPFEVRDRFSGEIKFTAQIECGADALPSVKLGLAVKWAIKSGANLSGADLSGAYLSGADLSGANLSGADLSGDALRAFKADLWLTLSEIGGPLEAQHTLFKLKSGKVDGGTYGLRNECACLVGTIAEAKGVTPESLSHSADRPAEEWFAMIKPGDAPANETGGGFAAAKAIEWIEGWLTAHGHPSEPDLMAVAL